jgi:hypothetical protein
VSPWIPVGVVVYFALAFWFAHRLGDFLHRTQAPPAGPRGRLVRERERAGRVEVLPTVGDAENARRRAERRT